MSCSRCQRSLPPGDSEGLCKRCVKKDAKSDTPTAQPKPQMVKSATVASLTKPEPAVAQSAPGGGASHVLSLRVKGSETGKKVTLPQTWEELKQLASTKVLSGRPVDAIFDADGDELDEIDVVWAMRPDLLYVAAAPASTPAAKTAPKADAKAEAANARPTTAAKPVAAKPAASRAELDDELAEAEAVFQAKAAAAAKARAAAAAASATKMPAPAKGPGSKGLLAAGADTAKGAAAAQKAPAAQMAPAAQKAPAAQMAPAAQKAPATQKPAAKKTPNTPKMAATFELCVADRELTCGECAKPFMFDLGQQAFFKERGYEVPTRCKECIAARKEKVKKANLKQFAKKERRKEKRGSPGAAGAGAKKQKV